MIDGEVVRSDGITKKIPPNVVEASRIESHNGVESDGSAGDALTHTQPFVESVGGAESN